MWRGRNLHFFNVLLTINRNRKMADNAFKDASDILLVARIDTKFKKEVKNVTVSGSRTFLRTISLLKKKKHIM